MTSKQPNKRVPESAGLNLGSIYYVLFRRKWLILSFCLAGLAAAVVLYLQTAKNYVSEAKLLVKYVLERKAIDPLTAGEQVRSPDAGGYSIINSELEILSSLDLAKKVAEVLGPDKVLPKNSKNPGAASAAAFINKNLKLANDRQSSVIKLYFEHPDPEMARKILQQLIEEYKTRHMEIHRGAGPLQTYFTQQRDKYRTAVMQTDEELRKHKNRLGVVSVEDARKDWIAQNSHIRQELATAEAELAERGAVFKQMESAGTVRPLATNSVALPEVPDAVLQQYRGLILRLDSYRRTEADLLTQFKENNILVKRNRALIEEADKQRETLEAAHPALKLKSVQIVGDRSEKTVDLAGESARIVALQAKIAVLRGQQEQTRTNLVAIEEIEPTIEQLQAKRNQDEINLRTYQTGLDRSMTETGGGNGGMPNIVPLQEASLAAPVTSRAIKQVVMALVAGIGGGVALAFLIELVLRNSVRHASQVEKKLGLPLLVTIPRLGRRFTVNGRKYSQKGRKPPADDMGGSSSSAASNGAVLPPAESASPNGSHAEIAPWDSGHALRGYYDALRDRLITFFETRNMTHKPKLVAVTSCSHGAGASSVAAGLAASLSETGDGNVLLVDMNLENGAAHAFSRGKPALGISDAFDAEERGAAHVQDNLYVVSANTMSSELPKALPKRFAHLVPRFKASDYDYIIFDMPAVTQTSLTPRLSSYMDMVLLVMEAEKTSADVAAKATELLRESGANVGAVLNRKRDFVPKWLLDEF